MSASFTGTTGSGASFEPSHEDPTWGHGAFTKVLLEALSDPAADTRRNGLITTNDLAQYVTTRVTALTKDRQHPGMEVRFGSTVFASGQ